MSGTPVHVVYFHGFASSPRSHKATILRAHLQDRVASFRAPALDAGHFPSLEWSQMVARGVEAIAASPADEPLLLAGSSMGGYLATHLLQDTGDRPVAALLICPAFGFTNNWAHIISEAGVEQWRREGTFPFYHHPSEEEVDLGVQFLESVEGLPPFLDPLDCPLHIIHGRDDDVVPAEVGEYFARTCPQAALHLVPGDHILGEPMHGRLLCWAADQLVDALVDERVMP